MRSFKCLFFIAAALAFSGLTAATDGGIPSGFQCAMRPVAAIDLEGTAVVDGLPSHFYERIDVRTGWYVRRWSSASRVIAGGEGFDGQHWWSQDLSGASHELDAPSAKALVRTIAWFNRQAWCAQLKDGTFSVMPPGGARMTLTVSGRQIVRTVVVLPEDHEIQTFSDWRVVDGMRVPFARRVDYPEDDYQETWAVSRVVTSRSALMRRAFASPAPPNDFSTINAADAVTMPLHIAYDKPRISIRLNGRGPFTYVLDSGGHFIATPATARTAGLEGIGSANESGAGTALLQTRFARVGQVDIGKAFIKDQVAKIIPYSHARLERAALPSATGWLGLETFERFAVTMDPLRESLTLSPFEHAFAPKGVRVPIVFDEDAPLISCTIAGKRGLCMIDTGNASNTIVEGHWVEQSALSDRLKRGLYAGDNTWVSRADIRIGSLDLPNEVVEYSPPALRGSESTTTVAAILSEDVLRRFVLTLNYDQHAAWFKPISGATARSFNTTGIEGAKQRDGTFRIAYVIAGSPAAQHSIKAGDEIRTMNGVDVRKISSPKFREWNAAAAGCIVTLRIRTRTGAMRMVRMKTIDLLPR